ncbi:MAG: hypothetical protein KC418_21335 [Anaerolineales bacterium]|nr:hypothetical protein [Anaerolineales bacterium]MCB8952117.1 hypothetical protein [Ardenticatenales bacterium]
MATNATIAQDLNELRSRLEWLDDERRKVNRKLAEVEQQVTLQREELTKREQRIKELERQVTNLAAQLGRMPQVEARLSQFKDEMVQMIEQYDDRQRKAQAEAERLRRVEHEVHTREIADMRRELPAIGRLRQDMDLRQAEDARLAQLIGTVQNQISGLQHEMEPWPREITFVNETTRRHANRLTELETALLEVDKKWEPIYTRHDAVANAVARFETDIRGITEAQVELRDTIKNWAEQVQLGEYERNQRVASWERQLEEQQGVMAQYAKQWATFSDQYQEAKMAVQSLAPWQKQLEQKQREEIERQRTEVNRILTQWQTFQAEYEKRWRNNEIDMEQRLAGIHRRDSQFEEKLTAAEEAILEIRQDKDMLWRVQAAQADALKQWPRLWMEEVEKTLAQNPNRRRQPALIPVREE